MERTQNTSPNKPRKQLFKKKKGKQNTKAKVTSFAASFYAQYGEMMSKLSHE